MEATSSATCSHTLLVLPSTSTAEPVLKLRLEKKKTPKQVVWSDGTVDNEHMNKKKSKCCCVYKKPLAFGESSSEEEEDCEHCYGHPEKRIKSHKKPHPDLSVTSDRENEPGCCHHNAQSDSVIKNVRVFLDTKLLITKRGDQDIPNLLKLKFLHYLSYARINYDVPPSNDPDNTKEE